MKQLKKADIEQKPWEDNLMPHQRDDTKESQILIWIWNCLEEISCHDFDQFLRDGVILCRLMNFVKPGSIKGEVNMGEDAKQKKKNVVQFIRACEEYGVPKQMLFDPDDLLYMRHIPRVTRCVYQLGKLVQQNSSYTGPHLGEEPYTAVNSKVGRRRGGLPFGDDIYVAHVSIKSVIQRLPSVSEG